LKVKWTDQWGATHEMSLEVAANELRKWTNEWPGGTEDVEAALARRDREIESLRRQVEALLKGY
jgi:hypothetical protein